MPPIRRARQGRQRVVAVTGSCAVLIAAVLSSCSSSSPDPAVTVSPAVLQADQDARTFQEEYSSYVSLPLDTMSEGDLVPLLTGDVLSESVAEIADARDKGTRFLGKYTYSGFTVTDHGSDANGRGFMVAQACLDVTGTRVLDATGHDVTPLRDPMQSMQMKAVQVDDGGWRISDVLRNDEVHACN
jgi:hypothetical protein